jgi:hypothetical protein
MMEATDPKIERLQEIQGHVQRLYGLIESGEGERNDVSLTEASTWKEERLHELQAEIRLHRLLLESLLQEEEELFQLVGLDLELRFGSEGEPFQTKEKQLRYIKHLWVRYAPRPRRPG